MIEVKGMCVEYPNRVAVREASFSVPTGSVTAFLGRNGAGKTTAIRAMLGFLQMKSGSASILGRPVQFDDARIREGVGYVPERPILLEHWHVGRTFSFASKLIPGWSDDEAKRLVERLKLDCSARIKTLSKGQRARVALILALAAKPRLLILDEPTSGLDPVVRRTFIDEILGMAAEEERSVLVSTHIVSEIEDVADRVVLMSDGRVAFEGTVDEATGGRTTLEEWFIARTAAEA